VTSAGAPAVHAGYYGFHSCQDGSRRKHHHDRCTDERANQEPTNETNGMVGAVVHHHRVVLVCGLPGAGKSTICRRIVKEYGGTAAADTADGTTAEDDEDTTAAGTTTGSHRLVHVIEYDQLMRMDSTSTPPQQQHPPSPDGDNNDDDDHHFAAWHSARTMALEQLRQRIRDVAVGFTAARKAAEMCSSNGDSGRGSSSSSSSSSFLTILDDNFYLRSMRKDVCRTLQQLQEEFLFEEQQQQEQQPQQPMNVLLLFGSVFVDVPVAICLDRNAARAVDRRRQQVPPHVIQRMHERMQVPLGTDTYYWDRCTFRLTYHRDDVAEEEDYTRKSAAPPWTDDAQWQSLHEFVQNGLQPIPYPRHDNHQQPQQQDDTTTNLAQRRDVYWRSCVSTIARQWPPLARLANQARRQCLSLMEASQLDFWRLLLANADLEEDDPVAHTLWSALLVLGQPPPVTE
jgi:predicted kinase